MIKNVQLVFALVCCISAEAQLVCEKPMFNFGERIEGDVVAHTFQLKNTGAETQTVERVATDCSCTLAKASVKSVAPGAVVDVVTSVNLKLREGRQYHKVHVLAGGESVTLTLRGVAVVRTEIKPRMLMFRNISPGSEHRRSVTLRGLRGPLKPGKPQSTSSKVTCILKEGTVDGEYILTAVLPADIPVGTFTATIKLPVYNNTQTLIIPVFASVR